MDTQLLNRVDADPETREKGRSAVIGEAVELYLAAKKRRENNAGVARAYVGEAYAILEEIQGLMDAQVWSDEQDD